MITQCSQCQVDSAGNHAHSCPMNKETQEWMNAPMGDYVDTSDDYVEILKGQIKEKDKTIAEQAEQITAITESRDYSAQVAADLAYEIGEHKETIKELLLADTKNTEICEKFEAQLIQANLDIIRLEKRNEDIQ